MTYYNSNHPEQPGVFFFKPPGVIRDHFLLCFYFYLSTRQQACFEGSCCMIKSYLGILNITVRKHNAGTETEWGSSIFMCLHLLSLRACTQGSKLQRAVRDAWGKAGDPKNICKQWKGLVKLFYQRYGEESVPLLGWGEIWGKKKKQNTEGSGKNHYPSLQVSTTKQRAILKHPCKPGQGCGQGWALRWGDLGDSCVLSSAHASLRKFVTEPSHFDWGKI